MEKTFLTWHQKQVRTVLLEAMAIYVSNYRHCRPSFALHVLEVFETVSCMP